MARRPGRRGRGARIGSGRWNERLRQESGGENEETRGKLQKTEEESLEEAVGASTSEDIETGGGKKNGSPKGRGHLLISPPLEMKERNLWRLRILVRSGGLHRIEDNMRSERLYSLFGLTWEQADKMKPAAVVRHATKYLDAVEARSMILPDPLSRNAEILGAALGLSKVEIKVLAVSVTFALDDQLRDIFEMAECAGPIEAYQTIALAIDEDMADVRMALQDEGALGDTSTRPIFAVFVISSSWEPLPRKFANVSFLQCCGHMALARNWASASPLMNA